MKKLLTPLAVSLASLACISCNKKPAPSKQTLIEGKVTNMQCYPDYKKFTLVVGDLGGRASTYYGLIQKDGTFKIRFDQYITQDVFLSPFVRTLIAHPGDSIHIDIDFKNAGTVNFSGDAAKLNNDLFHYVNENYVYFDPEILHKCRQTMDTTNFIATCTTMRSELMQKRQDFIDKMQPDTEFKTWSKNYVSLQYYNTLFDFRTLYMMHNHGAANSILDYRITPADIDEMYNDKLLTSGSYSLLMHLYAQHNEQSIEGGTLEHPDIFTAIGDTKTNPVLKQMMLGHVFSGILDMNRPEMLDKRKQYLDSITEPFIKQPLLKYYRVVKANLANPKTESDTIYKAMAGTYAETIIDSLKKGHPGNVIYINFWATWCGPCLAEIPRMQAMLRQYQGKDVVFISVCVFSGYNEWQETRTKYGMKDAGQIFCPHNMGGGLVKGLRFSGIPYFIIIDKKGYITDKGNQFIPTANTAARLNQLLLQ